MRTLCTSPPPRLAARLLLERRCVFSAPAFILAAGLVNSTVLPAAGARGRRSSFRWRGGAVLRVWQSCRGIPSPSNGRTRCTLPPPRPAAQCLWERRCTFWGPVLHCAELGRCAAIQPQNTAAQEVQCRWAAHAGASANWVRVHKISSSIHITSEYVAVRSLSPLRTGVAPDAAHPHRLAPVLGRRRGGDRRIPGGPRGSWAAAVGSGCRRSSCSKRQLQHAPRATGARRCGGQPPFWQTQERPGRCVFGAASLLSGKRWP